MPSRIGDLAAATVLVGTSLIEVEAAAFAASNNITVANFFTAIPVALTSTVSFGSITGLATPSAYIATTGTFFASTVSGATLMGFGTTNDVSLKNRAGTTVIGVGPNTTAVTLAGATTIAAGGLSMTAASGNGIAIGAAVTADTLLYLSNTSVFNSTVTLYGMYANPTFPATATTAGYVLYAKASTAASAFTMTNAYGLYVDTLAKGATSVVTNNYGIYVNTASGGATLNYGIYVAGGSPAIQVAAGGLTFASASGNTIGIGATNTSSSCLLVTGGAGSGTTRYGINVNYQPGESGGTVAQYGGYFGPTSAALSYTVTTLAGVYIDAVAKGAGSAITNRYGLYVVAPTDGATINHAIYSTGSIVSAGATQGIGYATGAGGAQTQGAGSGKGTTVVSNTVTTLITMNNAALNLLTIVSFTFTNSSIAATDHVIVEHQSGGTMGCYDCWCTPGGGTSTIYVKNISAGSLSEAIVIRATVIKAVSA